MHHQQRQQTERYNIIIIIILTTKVTRQVKLYASTLPRTCDSENNRAIRNSVRQ